MGKLPSCTGGDRTGEKWSRSEKNSNVSRLTAAVTVKYTDKMYSNTVSSVGKQGATQRETRDVQ